MGKDLPVCQGTIDPRPHRAQISLAHLGIDRGTGQFPIRQTNAVLAGSDRHGLEKLGADLVTESARAAMDADHHIALLQAIGIRNCGIIHRRHILHFQIMVSRTERTHFISLALLGMVRDLAGIRAGHTTIFFDALQILR